MNFFGVTDECVTVTSSVTKCRHVWLPGEIYLSENWPISLMCENAKKGTAITMREVVPCGRTNAECWNTLKSIELQMSSFLFWSLKRNIYNSADALANISSTLSQFYYETSQIKNCSVQFTLASPKSPKKGLKLGSSSKLCLSESCRSRCEKRKFFLLISNWLTQRRNKLFKRSSADCSTRGVTLRNAARNTTDRNMRGCVKIAPWYFARQIIHGKWQNNRGRKHFLDFWSWRLLCTPRGQPVSVSWKHY